VKHLRVRPVVGFSATRVGKVQPAVLHGQYSPVTQKIMYTRARLDIKLEISGKITTVNIGA